MAGSAFPGASGSQRLADRDRRQAGAVPEPLEEQDDDGGGGAVGDVVERVASRRPNRS